MDQNLDFSVDVEKTSEISRRLKIKIPASTVKRKFDQDLARVQKTANLKGFRPGHVPLDIVRQYYSDDVRHRLYHQLVDQSVNAAVQKNTLRVVGQPSIQFGPATKQDAAEKGHVSEEHSHKHDEHADHDHDHASHSRFKEDEDFEFTATVEVMPELNVKDYKGLALKRESAEVKDENVDSVLNSLRDSRAELVPIEDEKHKIATGEYIEINYRKDGSDERKTHIMELGTDSLFPGLDDQLVGMKRGQIQKAKIHFPVDHKDETVAGKEVEYEIELTEIKKKKLPELDDEFAKELSYESATQMREETRKRLEEYQKEQSDMKLRIDLMAALVKKNPFEVPKAIVMAQTRALAEEWVNDLKDKGIKDEKLIQSALGKQLDKMKERAEQQVRGSFILEAIAAREKIEGTPEDLSAEMDRICQSANVSREDLEKYYEKNPSDKRDLEFRVRQDKTVRYLLEQAKIK